MSKRLGTFLRYVKVPYLQCLCSRFENYSLLGGWCKIEFLLWRYCSALNFSHSYEFMERTEHFVSKRLRICVTCQGCTIVCLCVSFSAAWYLYRPLTNRWVSVETGVQKIVRKILILSQSSQKYYFHNLISMPLL